MATRPQEYVRQVPADPVDDSLVHGYLAHGHRVIWLDSSRRGFSFGNSSSCAAAQLHLAGGQHNPDWYCTPGFPPGAEDQSYLLNIQREHCSQTLDAAFRESRLGDNMAGPFVVENTVPGTQVWAVDAAGNTVQNGNISIGGNLITTGVGTHTIQGTLTTTGVQVMTSTSGDNTAAEAGAHILSTLLIAPQETSGTQLSDLTRDYECYVTCTAGGTNNTLSIGSSSAASNATIFAVATMAAGTWFNFRLPAGWYIQFNGTGTLGTQLGIGC